MSREVRVSHVLAEVREGVIHRHAAVTGSSARSSTWAAASMSDSGTCWLLQDDLFGELAVGSGAVAVCNGAVAIGVIGAEW